MSYCVRFNVKIHPLVMINYFKSFILAIFITFQKKLALVLPIGLYSILNPFPLVQEAVLKWTIISMLEDMWLGGIEAPQYFPIMGDVLEPPS